MKLSTKGRYGLRAMVDLAVNSVTGHVPIKDIAERQQLSKSYLEQVFASLRKAGFVKSIKGTQGGYILSRHPGEIKVGEVLNALEGDLEIVNVEQEVYQDTDNAERVIQRLVWDRMNQCISELVNAMTLEYLADEFKRTHTENSYTYEI